MSKSASRSLGPVLYQPTTFSRADRDDEGRVQSKQHKGPGVTQCSSWQCQALSKRRLLPTIHFLEHAEHDVQIAAGKEAGQGRAGNGVSGDRASEQRQQQQQQHGCPRTHLWSRNQMLGSWSSSSNGTAGHRGALR